jgi:hypothetical protein
MLRPNLAHLPADMAASSLQQTRPETLLIAWTSHVARCKYVGKRVAWVVIGLVIGLISGTIVDKAIANAAHSAANQHQQQGIER